MQNRAAAAVVLLLLYVVPGSGAAQATQPTTALSGQVRLRGEWDGRTTATGDDAATLSRVRVGLATRARPWLVGFIQLQDARAWGTETDPADGSADQLDVHQAYLDIAWGSTSALRAGRQELELGDGRLVGPSAWANTARSFDGLVFRRNFNRGHVRAFWMSVMERDAVTPGGAHPQQNEGDDTDGWLLGAYLARDLAAGAVELTLVHDRKAVTDESWTAQGRVHASRSLSYDLSAAYQFGPRRSAYLFSGALGTEFGQGGRIGAQLDYLSGDDDPADQERKAFQSLYPNGHPFHGYMDYFTAFPGSTSAAGLVDAVIRLQAPVRAPWGIRADVHHFSLAEERQGERSLGIETDLIATRALGQGVSLEGGASALVPGDAMVLVAPAFSTGPKNVAYWGYLMMTVSW